MLKTNFGGRLAVLFFAVLVAAGLTGIPAMVTAEDPAATEEAAAEVPMVQGD